MRNYFLLISTFLATQITPAFASDLGVNVILSGEVRPGIYGQVQLGNAPRPVLVYERPRVIVVNKRYAHEEPVYLHVPPGHAKHWDKHCREYHACSRRVYFVRSEEYDPHYHRHENHDNDRYEREHHDHHDDKRKGRGRGP